MSGKPEYLFVLIVVVDVKEELRKNHWELDAKDQSIYAWQASIDNN